jgi:hypothetical protein
MVINCNGLAYQKCRRIWSAILPVSSTQSNHDTPNLTTLMLLQESRCRVRLILNPRSSHRRSPKRETRRACWGMVILSLCNRVFNYESWLDIEHSLSSQKHRMRGEARTRVSFSTYIPRSCEFLAEREPKRVARIQETDHRNVLWQPGSCQCGRKWIQSQIYLCPPCANQIGAGFWHVRAVRQGSLLSWTDKRQRRELMRPRAMQAERHRGLWCKSGCVSF